MERITFAIILCTVFEVTLGEYIYFAEKKTWHDAQTYCRTTYTDLAVVYGANDYALLLAAGPLSPKGWIGLHRDSENISLWRWSGAGEITFHNWDVDQPNNYAETQYAVRIRSSGKWNDFYNKTKSPFYCIRFLLIKVNLTWEMAMESCRMEDREIPHLTQGYEHLMNQMQREGVRLAWIGLRFLGDQWLWISGAPLEPQTLQEVFQCPVQDRCGALNAQGQLQSWDCQDQLYFICE